MEFCFEIGFPFINNPKNPDPSYKTDLDFLDCFGRTSYKTELNFLGLFWKGEISFGRRNTVIALVINLV